VLDHFTELAPSSSRMNQRRERSVQTPSSRCPTPQMVVFVPPDGRFCLEPFWFDQNGSNKNVEDDRTAGGNVKSCNLDLVNFGRLSTAVARLSGVPSSVRVSCSTRWERSARATRWTSRWPPSTASRWSACWAGATSLDALDPSIPRSFPMLSGAVWH